MFSVLANEKEGTTTFYSDSPLFGNGEVVVPQSFSELLDKPIPGIIVLVNSRCDTHCTLISIA